MNGNSNPIYAYVWYMFFSRSLDWNPQQPQKMYKLQQKTSGAGEGKQKILFIVCLQSLLSDA